MKKQILCASLFFFMVASFSHATTLKIGIMQDKSGVAHKYRPVVKYLRAKGIHACVRGHRNYSTAALQFEEGKVDAMFAGSGVAGSMMIKNLAYPLVRPVSAEGWSTYWAVIVASKGSPKFHGSGAYFGDRRIACCLLASSGKFFAQSLLGKDRELIRAGTHGLALEALSKNRADIVIIKNRVWDSEKSKYPKFEQVGKDSGENPDSALIVSFKTDLALVKKVKEILLGIEKDISREAEEVKTSLNITKYIITTEQDFAHTLELLKRAGVTKDFDFN